MSDERDDSGQPWWHETPEELDGENPAGVGTAAQEAVRLAAAVASWASRTGLSDTMRGIAEQTAGSVRAAARAAAAGSEGGGRRAEGDEYAASGPPDSVGDGDQIDDGEEVDDDEGEEPRIVYESTCDYCPVCQGMTLLRTVSPEAAEGMAEALAAVTDAVRQAVEGMAAPSDSGARVEHIHVE